MFRKDIKNIEKTLGGKVEITHSMGCDFYLIKGAKRYMYRFDNVTRKCRKIGRDR